MGSDNRFDCFILNHAATIAPLPGASYGKHPKNSFIDCIVSRLHKPLLISGDVLWLAGALLWLAVVPLVWLSMLVVSAVCQTILRAGRVVRWTLNPSHALGSLLILCLLTTSTPAAPQTILAVTKDSISSFAFWYNANSIPRLFQRSAIANLKPQEKQSDRDGKVTRIQIFPSDVTVDVSDRVQFSAVAYDSAGNTVGGVKIKWSGQAAIPQAHMRISQQGEFEAIMPGTFTITAQGGGRTAHTTVTVQTGPKRNFNLPPVGTHQVSSRDLPTVRIGSAKEKKNGVGSARVFSSQRAGGSRSVLAKRAHAANTKTEPDPMPQGGGGGWDDSNYWSAGKPENRVGDPPGAQVDGGSGSGNFQFAAPVFSSSGRGLSTALGVAYNSRLWNRANSQISYDNDRGWPAPGFNLGFGKLLGMGVYNGCMLVDADGTRHSYGGSITFYSWGTIGVMHTTDGSFIDYIYVTGTNGYLSQATARLPNGTVVSYGARGPGGLFPVSIEDVDGNYINITYVNNAGPGIQTVTDTLGRTISFSYDTNNLLTAITAPGYISGTRTLVRFHYHQMALNPGFNGLSVSVRDWYPWVLDGIFYPATNTGYWLNDSDSYSSYGMLAKVVEERNMSFSSSSLNDMGTLSQGSITKRDTYSYPLTPDYSLTDAPTYTTMLEEWTRDGSNFDSATTSYEVHDNDNPRTTTITLPNGTKSKQYSFNAPGQYNDGLVYHDVTFTNDENNPLQSSYSYWEQGAYNTPRPTRVEKTDERNQTTATAFSYGSGYNQVTEVRDYDYGGATLLRSTQTTYQNSTNYTGTCNSYGCSGRHIFNLPLTVEIYDGSYNRLTRTEYQYDGQTLTAAPNVVQHDQSYNPYADQEGYCYYEPDWNDGDCNGSCMPNCPECIQDPTCDGYCPQIYICPYDSSTDFRGNVTQINNYANVDNYSATSPVSETRRYDITGNMVTASASCCQQTSLTYTVNSQYSHPESKTQGSATDWHAQVTTSATYDFNTGLGKTASDTNGRPSITDYDPGTLRPTSLTLSTGAHTDFSYDDNAMTVTSTSYLASSEGGSIEDQNIKYLNGAGQVRIEKALGANSAWDEVDTTYNNLGQVYQQSRPYRVGSESPVTNTMVYDALGRTSSVTAPDGSITQTFYNEASRPSVASSSPGETTRVQDAWGRERWGRTDASGKLVEVVEPDPNGGGSVAGNGMVTTYSYNTLGNLTQTNQGGQLRSFKYDSLGRLMAQKLAEMNATLNDAGTYVGSGTWSDVLTYDDRSNVTSRTDARGVKTVYSYNSDPLNRLQSVSWDTSGFGDTSNPILPAATVSYSYRTKSASTDSIDVTQLSSVATSGVSTESYSYDDGEGRVTSKTLTLTSRSGYPFQTDYIYDSLDRVKDVRYPAEYGNGSAPRKIVHHDYDISSRLSALTYDSQSFVSNIVYNAVGQTTSLNVGTGANQVNESYTYNSQTGLLDQQTATRGGTTLLNLSYDYTNAAGKRTGQLTKISNNLDHNKDRGYEYDALGRLRRATGGLNVNWAQRYEYDRYGNRWNAYSYTADSYVRNFYQSALNRQPTSGELSSWLSTLQSAYASGQSSFLNAMQNLGASLFTSQEYLNRNRSDRDFVYDLYKAFLYREPEQSGWDFWTNAVPSNGRDNVRLGFAYSTEFSVKVSAISPYSPPNGTVPPDGLQGIAFDNTSNRILNSGWSYDAAGNQTRASIPGSSANFQRYQYDAANRMVKVKQDDNSTVIASYTYGDSNERLVAEQIVQGVSERTYYVGEGGATIAEFTENGGTTTPSWSKSYVYLGTRLLSTLTPNGSGGEAIEYDHPDRLGTRLVTNPQNGTSFEQLTLPFGSGLDAESTGAIKRRFTSYDRSGTTGLDYAVNRHYDSQQGRFTQVDPAGMNATALVSPQTLNLYAYCVNDPINHTDPSGLGFFSSIGKLFKGIAHLITKIITSKVFLLVVGIALGVLAGFGFYFAATITTHFYLAAAIALAAMSAVLIVGAFHPNFLRVVRTIGGIASTIQGIGGAINSIINGQVLGTPPWNGSAGAVSHFLGGQGLPQEPDVVQIWSWAYGWKIHALMERIRQALCRAVPRGRTSGVQLSAGAKAGPTAGVEIVQNFRSGQTSGFAFGGGQVGVVGGGTAQVNTGFIWGNLDDKNSNYAGPFASASGSYGTFGGFVQSGSGLTVVGGSAGVSVTPFTATAGITKYTKPLQLGRWWYQVLNDNAIDRPLILANQACR